MYYVQQQVSSSDSGSESGSGGEEAELRLAMVRHVHLLTSSRSHCCFSLQLLADQMFSHLPEPERASALRSKVRHLLHVPYPPCGHVIRGQVVELDVEVQRAEQLVRSTRAQLSCGHGNQDSLRRQLVKK